MRSLDDFYKYIEKQEKALLLSASEETVPAPDLSGEPGEPSNDLPDPMTLLSVLRDSGDLPESEAADAPVPALPQEQKAARKKAAAALTGPAAASPPQQVRYILRGGVTLAVAVEPEAAKPAVVGPAARARTLPSPATSTNDTEAERDYLPPIIEEQEPSQVADAPARLRRNGAAASRHMASDPAWPDEAAAPDLTDAAAAALWQRLPRHIQLLVEMAEPEQEVAQKYYARGFKESRRQLIERLLDPTLTLEDTARVLGVCPTTVRRYTNRGILPHHRTVGQQRRFRLSDVLAFLEQQKTSPAGNGKREKVVRPSFVHETSGNGGSSAREHEDAAAAEAA